MGLEKLISVIVLLVMLAASSKTHRCCQEGTGSTHPRHESVDVGNADVAQGRVFRKASDFGQRFPRTLWR
jgi:hypothetical protein